MSSAILYKQIDFFASVWYVCLKCFFNGDCMKVSILGAAGKVGSEVTRLLAEQTSFSSKIDVVLYTPNNVQKISGQLQDLQESLLTLGKSFSNHVSFYPSNNLTDMKGSNLLVITAGLFASKEEKEAYKLLDPSGRNIQSFKNAPLVANLCYEIKKYAPKSSVLVVTNQSDTMSELARSILGKQKVYGLGCYLDTLRFKKIFADLAHLSYSDFEATILGFHSKDMFLNDATFKINKKIKNAEEIKLQAIKHTISRGKEISDTQKDVHHIEINSGASKLPAACIFNIIKAYTQKDYPLTIPLNRLLEKAEKALIKGDIPIGVQLPCQISYKKINTLQADLNQQDINSLRQSLSSFITELNSFFENIGLLQGLS